jgi:predicted Zn-dependent protease
MKILSTIVVAFLLAGCLAKTPVTNRNQVIFMSPQEESALGAKNYKEFLATAKLSTNRAQTQRIRNIGRRIAKAANKPDYKWEFNLVEDKQVNAWCMPGGKVVVYTGILQVAQNDDQLATVMSHEIAHALARHGAERMSHQQISNTIGQFGSVLIGGYAPEYTSAFNTAYSTGVNVGVMLPFSRSHETEADEIGVRLMAKAGYDVNEAIRFWENMRKLKGGSANQSDFLSTHPSDDKRIKNITKLVQKIKSGH